MRSVATSMSVLRAPSDGTGSNLVWKLGKLNHVALAVPDLEKASSLYRDVLGASVSQAMVSQCNYCEIM